MKQLINFGAARIGAAIQNVGAKVDFEVLSLPGGSLIAVLLWLYASALGSTHSTYWRARRLQVSMKRFEARDDQ